jgi:predicted membrane-bound spermidine synthase
MPAIQMMPIRLTSLLSFIFFFSGFAALMYQVAWQRLLTVYYGVGSIRSRNKIIIYFIVELLIGCFGLISLPFLDFLGRYTAGSSYILSFFYMFLFLSMPTFLMGMTLPLLTKIFNSLIRNFLSTVSLLYFTNTIGAAIGALFCSYVVISFWGLDNAIYCAAAINFILALLIFSARFFPDTKEEHAIYAYQDSSDAILGKTAYLMVLITGFLAIGYEIAWFRIIHIFIKTSPYAFSSVLFVYLLGIALGSYGMNHLLTKKRSFDRISLFFFLQFLIGFTVIGIIIGYYYLTEYTPFEIFTRKSFALGPHPILTLPSMTSLKTFLSDSYFLIDVLLWPFIFVFIPTVLMGASFPLISLLALSQKDKEGKTVGSVYFFNIMGNVFGGICTGFLLLPYWGTEITLFGFSSIGLLFMIFVKRLTGKEMHLSKRIAVVLVVLVVSALFFPKNGQLYEIMHGTRSKYKKYFKEGRDGIIMTYMDNDEILNFINGLSHGGRPDYQNFYWVLEAASYAPRAENVLVIGYGTGNVTEALLKMESLRKVTVVELNDTLIGNLKKIPLLRTMLDDRRVNLIVDDGRRFLLRSDEKFDLIFMDPLRLYSAYSNNLYSLEFFNLARKHLRDEGLLMLYTHQDKIIAKTLISSLNEFKMYNRFMLASRRPLIFNKERRDRYFERLSPIEKEAVIERRSLEAIYDDDYQKNFTKLLAPYPVNHDWKPVTEYYIGSKYKKYD